MDIAGGGADTDMIANLDRHRMDPCITSPFENETDHPDCEESEYKTKLAIAISKALGRDSTLNGFDNIRHIIKTRKHQGLKALNAHIQEHEILKNQLHTKLNDEKDRLKQKLKSYEQDYLKQHGLLPRPSIDEQYQSLIKQRNYIKWLLSTWKTNFN
jgi:hypothetical protein